MAGMPLYLELIQAVKLAETISRQVGIRNPKGQGWLDSQLVIALILLNIAGGDCLFNWRGAKGFAIPGFWQRFAAICGDLRRFVAICGVTPRSVQRCAAVSVAELMSAELCLADQRLTTFWEGM